MTESNKTILLVEDEVLISMAEERQLVNAGYNVITAYNGEDAVNIVSGGMHNLDLILMDIDLGRGMDGTTAAMEILKYRDIPILFQSSHTEKDIVEKTEMITSYGYVVKNSGITILDASIKMAFKLHKAHSELKEKEKNLLIKERAIESSINAIAISDPEGKLAYVNPSFRKLWNCENNNDVIGKSASYYWSECSGQRCLKDLINMHGGWNGELIARRTDGSFFNAEVSAGNIIGQDGSSIGMIAAFQDITERKRTEKAIRESRESYRILVENINYLVCEIDSKGNYTYLSPTYKSITGYEPEELLGKNVREGLHHDDMERWRERYYGKEMTNPSVRDLWRFRIKSGEWRWMECSVSYYEKSPGEKRVVVISSDITDWINSEKERYALVKKKEMFLQEIQNRIKSNIVIIRMYLEHLFSRTSERSFKEMLAGSENRILFMVKIYEQLFTSSNPDDIRLYDVIKAIISYISEIYKLERLNINVSESLADVKINVHWAVPVGIIISELVINSAKFGASRDREPVITISNEIEDGFIKIFVKDNGPGFNNEYSERSQGLGLFLVELLLKQIEGKLIIENLSGAYVQVIFKL